MYDAAAAAMDYEQWQASRTNSSILRPWKTSLEGQQSCCVVISARAKEDGTDSPKQKRATST